MSGHIEDRPEDYRFRGDHTEDFTGESSIRVDDTILPGGRLYEDIDFGILLRPSQQTLSGIETEIEQMLLTVDLKYRLATETSIGKDEELELRTILNSNELAQFVSGQLHLE